MRSKDSYIIGYGCGNLCYCGNEWNNGSFNWNSWSNWSFNRNTKCSYRLSIIFSYISFHINFFFVIRRSAKYFFYVIAKFFLTIIILTLVILTIIILTLVAIRSIRSKRKFFRDFLHKTRTLRSFMTWVIKLISGYFSSISHHFIHLGESVNSQ